MGLLAIALALIVADHWRASAFAIASGVYAALGTLLAYLAEIGPSDGYPRLSLILGIGAFFHLLASVLIQQSVQC